MRIYFTGSHSCGKSTLSRWVAEHYGLPLIGEVAREILDAEMQTLDGIRSNVMTATIFQNQVFRGQLAKESSYIASHGEFVSDRSFDFLVYTAFHGNNAAAMLNHEDFQWYLTSLKAKDAIVFFVRPQLELLKSDGQRSEHDLRWEEVNRVDGAIECCLELFDIPYVSIAELSMKRRIRLVENVLRVAGVKAVAEKVEEEEIPF